MMSLFCQTSQQNTFMTLPSELRGMIYNSLPQPEAMGMRSVSIQVKQEIDSFYKCIIDLDKNIPEETLHRLVFECRVKYIKIGYTGMHFLASEVDLKRGRKNFLEFPGVMRHLDISTLRNITEQNIRMLLHECGDSLEGLFINFDQRSDNAGMEEPREWTRMKFPNLKKLHLVDSRFSGEKVPAITSENDILLNVIHNLAVSAFKLKAITIEMKLKPKMNESEWKAMPVNERLDKISALCDHWIRNQDKLEYLKLDQIICYKASLLQRIIQQNFNTLNYLEMYFRYVDNFKSEVFDISLFCKCVDLKELYLVLPWSYYKDRLTQDLVNFHLPQTLVKACIAGFRILSPEMKSCIERKESHSASGCVHGGKRDNVGETTVTFDDYSDICYYVLF